MIGIEIEKASIDDAKEIVKYFKLVGGESDDLLFGSEGIGKTPKQEAAYIKNIENSCDEVLFIAKANDRILGHASLVRLPKRMRHRGELSVAVLRDLWYQGIDAELITKALEYAKENSFEVIDVHIRSRNTVAIKLYQKFGFKKVGTHLFHLSIGNEYVPFEYMSLLL